MSLKYITLHRGVVFMSCLHRGAAIKNLPILDAINTCTKLLMLNLKRTDFVLTEKIRQLINLRELKLPSTSDPKRMFEAFSALLDLTNLKKLHVDDQKSSSIVKLHTTVDETSQPVNNTSTAPMQVISQMTQLIDLTLPSITPNNLLNELTRLTSLRVLKITGKTPDLNHLLSHVSQLRRLAICYSNIDDEQIIHLSKLKYLQTMDLFGCSQITSVSHVDLPRGLTYVSLALSKVDDTSLEYISKQLPNLVNLDLFGCDNITDAGVRELVNLTQLTTLCVRALNTKLSPYTAYQFFPWKMKMY